MQRDTVYFIWKLLYMFRVVPPNNCIYSIWYLSPRYCYLPLSWKSWNRFECAVGGVRHPQHTQTVSDVGWRYHPKHVQQFPDKINCVTLHLVGYILEYYHRRFATTYRCHLQVSSSSWNVLPIKTGQCCCS